MFSEGFIEMQEEENHPITLCQGTASVYTVCQNTGRHRTDLTVVWVEVWVVCAGQDKTPGETLTGVPDTAGLSWDTDQEDSMTLESGKQMQTINKNWGEMLRCNINETPILAMRLTTAQHS